MCLITKQKTPKIAKRDMVVYKAMSYGLYSQYHSFKYEIGKVFRTTLKTSKNPSPYDSIVCEYLAKNFTEWREVKALVGIGQGFHSAKTKERLLKHCPCPIYKCIIPKGSKYYNGFTGLMVSNKIMIKEKLNSDQNPERSVATEAQ